jgi:hypothetical protein
MSVVKRYFNKKSILYVYERGGVDSVVTYIKHADVGYIEDSFASEVTEAVKCGDIGLVADLLKNESAVHLNLQDS